MRRGKKTKGLWDMDFNAVYNDPFFYESKYYHPYCNIDSERIQEIIKKNGKVTWGDVYEPWLTNREWYDNKVGITGEESALFSTDPKPEMKCVLDVHFGDWFWIPKD